MNSGLRLRSRKEMWGMNSEEWMKKLQWKQVCINDLREELKIKDVALREAQNALIMVRLLDKSSVTVEALKYVEIALGRDVPIDESVAKEPKPCPCGSMVCQLTDTGWVCDKCRRPYLGDYEFGDVPTEQNKE